MLIYLNVYSLYKWQLNRLKRNIWWCDLCKLLDSVSIRFLQQFKGLIWLTENIFLYCCCCCCLVRSIVSDSVRPHRWQPTRLPRPWDSPGKSTGVGCHFLLQCMKVKSEREVTQSYLTLSDPMDCSQPGSSIHRIFQARVLEWGAIAFSVSLH